MELRQLARQRTAEAVTTLIQAMRHATEWGHRIRAAEVLLERGWGRPEVAIDLKNSDGSFAQVWAQAVSAAVNPEEAQSDGPAATLSH